MPHSSMSRFCFVFFSVIPSLFGFDIVLDIDHSSNEFTSTLSSSCESERTYNLNLSRYIIAHTSKEVSVEMKTRKNKFIDTGDNYLSNMYKDLLIGIHHGSVQKQYIQRNSFGCPTSREGSGFAIFISRKNPHFSKSLMYARKLATALREEGLSPSLHHTDKIAGENKDAANIRLGIYYSDDLALLKNSKFPALLLEPGIIVNPSDDIRVRSDSFKSKIAHAISQLK